MNDIEKVINRIQELIPQAPSNWVKIVADRMGKSEASIRGYATGTKHPRSEKPIEVLKHLRAIIEERRLEIEKLTK